MLRQRHLLILLLAISSSLSFATSSDPSPLQDYCIPNLSSFISPCKAPSNLTGADFASSLFRTPPNATASPLGYAVTRATASTFPALNTAGISASRAEFAVNGVNSPHVHPRASELVYVEKGKLWAGFVDGEGRLFSATIEAGDLFIIPQGLIHFQMNVGTTPATVIVSFSSQNPGTSRIPNALFGSQPAIADETLLRSFDLTPEELGRLRQLLGPH